MCRVDDIFDMAAEVRERGGGEMDGQEWGKWIVIEMNPLRTFFKWLAFFFFGGWPVNPSASAQASRPSPRLFPHHVPLYSYNTLY